MKCNMKTMLKVAISIAVALAIGYVAVPQYRTAILGLIPIAAVLVCPLSMLVMMWLMRRRDQPDRHSGESPAPHADLAERRSR